MVGVLGSPKGMQHILPAEMPGNGQMPILAAVPLFYPPEQQCYLTTINTLPPGWCTPVFPLPRDAKERKKKMGTDISFSEAVQAIVAHNAKLYELLLAVFPAYHGEGEMPPRESRASRILDCEKNDAHRLLEELATAANRAEATNIVLQKHLLKP